ncbi:hypothetical protein [Lentzea albidocapillata]|uniref:hypothetical protein n=1 Tax=Lentzea albidocapillata TaxID=40571 RepID=UPI0004C42753|nr:hypothetical protein [Lentzea albidocapillata]
MGLVFDILATASCAGVSVLALWRGHSWLFGLSLSVVMLPVFMCLFRWFVAYAFEMPAASRSELNLHAKQVFWTFAAGFLVVAVRTLAEPVSKGVTDPVSLLMLVVLVGPLVQHAVKMRHLFGDAVAQLKPPRSGRRMPGLVKRVRPPSSSRVRIAAS